MGESFFSQPVEVSVGLEGGSKQPTDVKRVNKKFYLIRIREVRFGVCTVLLLLVLIALLVVAARTNLVRDAGAEPTGQDEKGKPYRKPFSLARCQMAFWFFLVIASFLYIWQVTGAYDIITAGILTLVGIAAGTALGAAVIDESKQDEDPPQLANLESEKPKLEAKISELETQINTAQPNDKTKLEKQKTAKSKRLEIVINRIQKTPLSEGFLKDILRDATGVAFHRFQIAVWTVILGIIFIYSVWASLSMPEFSATLLALQGISAGTYIGFKIPESK
jgi:hypothetical protein